jgi:DNA-binding NtrC family response regulator
MTAEQILVVDDAPANIHVLAGTLESAGYEVLAANNGLDACRIARKARPSLILLDIVMPEPDGLETCRRLKHDPSTATIPVLFLTARDENSSVLAAFQVGGVDYVVKPFQSEELLSRVATHLRLHRLTTELQEKNRILELRTAELTAEIGRRRDAEAALSRADQTLTSMSAIEAERWEAEGLIGRSTHWNGLIQHLQRIQQFPNLGVLITGESGTGKELIARAIHFGSDRAKAPFVPVNCVAIPAELAESMLFGHVRGAFTGANSERKGYFQLADGGTLFLDEIGDMPPQLQAKLLRVLEDGWVTPVGSSESRHVDVRIVAATNADLERRIQAGTFRSDLFFRLARYTLATIPLRDRPEDIPVLANHFLRRFATEMKLPTPPLTPQALESLQAYSFPGNVRELKNIVEGALIDGGSQPVQPHHIKLSARSIPIPSITSSTLPALPPQEPPSSKLSGIESLPLNLAEAEDLLIQRALQESGGNIADAARRLGIHRTRIYRKLAQENGRSES